MTASIMLRIERTDISAELGDLPVLALRSELKGRIFWRQRNDGIRSKVLREGPAVEGDDVAEEGLFRGRIWSRESFGGGSAPFLGIA